MQLNGILCRLSSDDDARAMYVSELVARFSASDHWNRRQMSVLCGFRILCDVSVALGF